MPNLPPDLWHRLFPRAAAANAPAEVDAAATVPGGVRSARRCFVAGPGDLGVALLLFLLHLAIAYHFRATEALDFLQTMRRGETVERDEQMWDFFWQTIPEELLREEPVTSIWHLHSQPPLYNIYGAVMMHLFGASYIARMADVNILLGSIAAALTYAIACRLTRRRWAGALIGLYYALNPTLFMNEAFLFYDIHTFFLVQLTVWCFLRHRVGGPSLLWLYLFLAGVNALILHRSMYHLLLAPAACAVAILLEPHRWRRLAVAALLITIPAGGWCLKNLYQFGFFGTSSWMGMNMWNVAKGTRYPQELATLRDEGVLDPMVVDETPFSLPSDYRKYGFDHRGETRLLDSNTRHNINYIDISRAYLENAGWLIAVDPGRYADAVFRAYALFCLPANHFLWRNQLDPTVKVATWIDGSLLQARWPVERIERIFGFYEWEPIVGSPLFFLIPISLLLFVGAWTLRCRCSTRAWRGAVLAEPGLWLVVLMTVYTVLCSCLFEFGENFRFRFMIEPPMLAFLLEVFLRAFAPLARRLVGLAASITGTPRADFPGA